MEKQPKQIYLVSNTLRLCCLSDTWSSAGCDSSYNDDRDRKPSQRQSVSKNKMQKTQGLLPLQCSVSFF